MWFLCLKENIREIQKYQKKMKYLVGQNRKLNTSKTPLHRD